MSEVYRILKDSGSMYVFSGWNNLKDILRALDDVGFVTINHIIWKYQFGVVTKKNLLHPIITVFTYVKMTKKRNSILFLDSKKMKKQKMVAVCIIETKKMYGISSVNIGQVMRKLLQNFLQN